MLPKYHPNYLVLKEKIPEHTNDFLTKGANDIVIIYSRFEDLFPGNKVAVGAFIPQWVGIGLSDKQHGWCINFSGTPKVLKTYNEMIELDMKKLRISKINRVLFYYKDSLTTINEYEPFQNEMKLNCYSLIAIKKKLIPIIVIFMITLEKQE